MVLDIREIIKECNEKRDFSPVKNIDITNITDLSKLFNECEFLWYIDLNIWSVSHIINMNYMFNSCYRLQSRAGVPGDSCLKTGSGVAIPSMRRSRSRTGRLTSDNRIAPPLPGRRRITPPGILKTGN